MGRLCSQTLLPSTIWAGRVMRTRLRRTPRRTTCLSPVFAASARRRTGCAWKKRLLFQLIWWTTWKTRNCRPRTMLLWSKKFFDFLESAADALPTSWVDTDYPNVMAMEASGSPDDAAEEDVLADY